MWRRPWTRTGTASPTTRTAARTPPRTRTASRTRTVARIRTTTTTASLDADDKCPNEPETINGFQDEDGCPDKGKVKVLVEGEKIVILEKIFFASNKATILPKSFPLLKQVAQVLKGNLQIEKVRVEGHTDDQGEDGANLALSRARAEAVRDRLVMEGIAADRLEALGYGEAKPIASNKTAKGREQNRRVEFTIVKVKPKEIEIDQP